MSIYLGNLNLPWERPKTPAPWGGESQQSISFGLINEFYTTNATEAKRESFSSFYVEKMYDDEGRRRDYLYNFDCNISESYRFYDALMENKKYLTTTLDIKDDEYDSMCCIALALASQETGMGLEEGYQEEQVKNMFNDPDSFITTITRKLGISTISDNSQSSGLTQIKIYDQFQNVFSKWDMSALIQRGVKVDGKVSDNLEIPEIAAIATIGVLKTIMDNFDEYKAKLDKQHGTFAKEFINQGIDPAEAEQKGFNYLSDVYEVFQNSTNKEKLEIQDAFSQWLLSENGTTKKNPNEDGEFYTEEIQLERLQKALGGKVELNQESLNYIRFALCSEDCQMDVTEYCAYAWNNGTQEKGMQLDRLLSGKICAIFRDSEIFNNNNKGHESQNNNYVGSVLSLIERYAQQGSSVNPYWAVEDNLDSYVEDFIRSYEWNNEYT